MFPLLTLHFLLLTLVIFTQMCLFKPVNFTLTAVSWKVQFLMVQN